MFPCCYKSFEEPSPAAHFQRQINAGNSESAWHRVWSILNIGVKPEIKGQARTLLPGIQLDQASNETIANHFTLITHNLQNGLRN